MSSRDSDEWLDIQLAVNNNHSGSTLWPVLFNIFISTLHDHDIECVPGKSSGDKCEYEPAMHSYCEGNKLYTRLH